MSVSQGVSRKSETKDPVSRRTMSSLARRKGGRVQQFVISFSGALELTSSNKHKHRAE